MALSPALRALMKDAQNKYSRAGSTVKMKEGKNQIRIIQTSQDGKFWADIGVHWIKAEANGKPLAVVGCREIIKDEQCEICDAIEQAARQAVDDESLKIIKDWKAKKSILLVALVRTDDASSEVPQIVEITPSTFTQIISCIDEYEESGVNILDPKSGHDIIIKRSGRGLDTEYTVLVAPKPSSYNAKSVHANLPNLEEFIEKNYFRGDEKKALQAIGRITGLSFASALAAPSGTALLTSRSGTVEGAVIEEDEPAPTRPVRKAAVVEEDIVDAEITEVEAAPVKKPAAKAAPATAVEDLDDDIDLSDLSELDDI